MSKLSQPSKSPGPGPDDGEYDPHGYEVKDAADTLLKAEEIKSNKKLMPHVHKHLHQKKHAVIKSLADLKKVSQSKRNAAANEEVGEPPGMSEESEGEQPLKMSDRSPGQGKPHIKK